ncbi:hypothetical protein LBMAG53_15600 [Planctomycetota bacterium]|nr:hypothetical protein LBMAG53_15600 [Planctomycetota bacterium]
MSADKPRYANFPERDLKVVIGEHINATNTKLLTKLTIGKYEMSFLQQENGSNTLKAVREAVGILAKAESMAIETDEKHREYLGITKAGNAEKIVGLWILTPFELTQSAHLIWCRWSELGNTAKTGVAFKVNTKFTADDIANLIRAAQKNAVSLAAGEAFTLKGNPPPRFQKKTTASALPVAEAVPA